MYACCCVLWYFSEADSVITVHQVIISSSAHGAWCSFVVGAWVRACVGACVCVRASQRAERSVCVACVRASERASVFLPSYRFRGAVHLRCSCCPPEPPPVSEMWLLIIHRDKSILTAIRINKLQRQTVFNFRESVDRRKIHNNHRHGWVIKDKKITGTLYFTLSSQSPSNYK